MYAGCDFENTEGAECLYHVFEVLITEEKRFQANEYQSEWA
jgi:hypothetical protein